MLRRAAVPLLLAALVLGAGATPFARPAAAQEAVADTLVSLLAGSGPLQLAGRELDRPMLASIYQARGFVPIWVGSPERAAALAKALAAAGAQGLDPAVFTVPKAPAAQRELLLTDAFLRYATALAQGRVSSAAIESDWAFPVLSFDAIAALGDASEGDVTAVLDGLLPTSPGYARLQDALARYRAIASAGGWQRVPWIRGLVLGDSTPGVAKLRRRLAAEGFLPAATASSQDYDAAAMAAVKRFQALHGIAVDGSVGPATLAALNVPVSARIRQIRDNLERWRELPRSWPATRIEVNVPAAWLTLFENDEPVLGMRAIVGAEKHPTPVLRAWMSAVLFNPPWNVPTSIVRKEILPHVRRDPHYLERNHYVYLGKPGASALQQLPGPENALGRIKFELPNVFDVYLHDTPSHPLFSRVIRTLSHGCVRLEDPRELALYVLGTGKSVWSMEDIDTAIALGDTRRVPLPHGIPVYLLYWTAFVDPDGSVEFRDDIYGRDERLEAAMTARDAAETPGTAPVPAISVARPAAAFPPPSRLRQKTALD